MEKEELLSNLGELMAGLAVPASISGGSILGAASGPWIRIHRGILPSGWHTPAEYTEALRKVMEDSK